MSRLNDYQYSVISFQKKFKKECDKYFQKQRMLNPGRFEGNMPMRHGAKWFQSEDYRLKVFLESYTIHEIMYKDLFIISAALERTPLAILQRILDKKYYQYHNAIIKSL